MLKTWWESEETRRHEGIGGPGMGSWELRKKGMPHGEMRCADFETVHRALTKSKLHKCPVSDNETPNLHVSPSQNLTFPSWAYM